MTDNNKSSIATKRLREVLSAMAEEDFTHLLYETKIVSKFAWFDNLRQKISKPKDPPEIRLRRMIEKLGPTFVKVGQLLSTRHDILPEEFVHELETLQDHVKPESWTVIKPHIEKLLGAKISATFKTFDKNPVASASIAQVYKATLKNGRKVAVKVQRPGVAEAMHRDIAILKYLASVLHRRLHAADKYHIQGIVREIEKWTSQELNFVNEEDQMEKFRLLYADNTLIVIPKVYHKYTNSGLLVMEYIDGIHLNDVDQIKRKGIDLRPVLKECFQATLQAILDHGTFHGDPHPGNFIITKQNKLAMLDFGIVGHFDEWLRSYTAKLLLAAIQEDADSMVQLLLDISIVEEDTDLDAIKKKVKTSLRQMNQSIEQVQVGFLFQQAINVAAEAHAQVPHEFLLFAKAIITMEGIAVDFDPTFNITKESEGFIKSHVRKEILDEWKKDNLAVKFYSISKSITDLPGLVHRILTRFEDGHIKLHIKDTDIKSLAYSIDHASQRLSFAALATACIIAGSMTIDITFFLFGSATSLSVMFFLLALYFVFMSLKNYRKSN